VSFLATVLKIGGGVLRDKASFAQTVKIIKEKQERKEQPVIVLSALYGVTDFLIDSIPKCIASQESVVQAISELKKMHEQYLNDVETKEIRERAFFALEEKLSILERFLYGIHYLKEVSPRSKDLVQSFGERLSPIVLEAFLQDAGLKARFLDVEEAGIYCKGQFENALVDLEKTSKSIHSKVSPLLKDTVVLLPGYYGLDENNDVKTFGRGGTDYSAGFIANILDARLEIWKDVSGFMSSDPKLVKTAKQIETLSYDEAEELGYLGSKILHPKTIDPLRKKGLSAEIKNIFAPEVKGTIIEGSKQKSREIVKSIASKKDVSIITIASSSKVNVPDFPALVFSALGKNGIPVGLIATSESAISFSVEPKDLEKATQALAALRNDLECSIITRNGLSLVGVVGEGMRETPGISGRIFSSLGRNGINIELISQGASEINVSFVVRKEDLEKATLAVHGEFMG